MGNNETVYYFAYGSNICYTRLNNSIKRPKFKCVAELKDFELVFCGSTKTSWRGAAANIRKNTGSSVCGAIWTIKAEDLLELDRQEGVHANIYRRVIVEVRSLKSNKTYTCVSYEKSYLYEPINEPSLAYKNVIINGAKQLNFPSSYIEYLRSFQDNGICEDINVNLPEELYMYS